MMVGLKPLHTYLCSLIPKSVIFCLHCLHLTIVGRAYPFPQNIRRGKEIPSIFDSKSASFHAETPTPPLSPFASGWEC
jgi:hypothetical protein